LPAFLLSALYAVQPVQLCAQTRFEQDCARLAAGKEPDTKRLHELFKLQWDYTMRENPEFASEAGYPGQNDRWSDISVEAIERRRRELQAPLKVIQSVDRATLSAADQLNHDLFKKNLELDIEGARFKDEYFQITQLSGVQQDTARILAQSPRSTVKDYRDIIARLNKLPNLIDQTIVLLGRGLETGITPPRVTLRDVPQQVKNQMVEDPDKNAFLRSFSDFPPEIPAAEQTRLRKEAAVALKEKMIPAFAKLHDFLASKYIPGARESIAMSDCQMAKPGTSTTSACARRPR
jgi:uncharacterized protein (DUF885 family)